MPTYAHSLKLRPTQEWQVLAEHLKGVAEAARRFAAAFGADDWGYLAGLWHDLGKFQPEFQAYIRGTGKQVEHAVVGARFAQSKSRTPDWLPLAFAINGHHAGLANLKKSEGDGPKPLLTKLSEAEALLARTLPHLPESIRSPGLPPLPERLRGQPGASRSEKETVLCSTELWIRFLFSTLVDADFLDTEAFYRSGDRARHTAGFRTVSELRQVLDEAVDQLAAGAVPSAVNNLRAKVSAACRQAAEEPPGIFSLSVPTGGGKTLAAMSFALRHAQRNGLRRVIAAIPFTSIIEQNAAVYRKALGEDQVIEHHSNLDPRKETRRNKLASENWDAPVVVTTNVQLFESLFARRTSRCRKLHNIARSVILLDEVQTLPTGYLLPILDVLAELRDHYGCSVVLSTATQPALKRRPALPQGLENVREIAPDPTDLARRLERFEVTWPGAEETGWEDLAGELRGHAKVLAVVHRRQDARDLARLLPEEGSFHLSALMCAAHRSARLDEIREALKTEECRVVSTQLVEAGVDLDFPVVYRALAGLDSLIQAGGRCNREGGPLPGQLVIFRAPTSPPPGALTRAFETMEALLEMREGTVDLHDPEEVQAYFRMLFQSEQLDVQGIQAERRELNFATVAKRFRLIEDVFQPIVVPWGDAAQRLDSYQRDPSRETLRALQPFLVNVPKRQAEQLFADGALEEVHGTVLAVAAGYHHLYDERFGLVIEEEVHANPADLVI